MTWRRLRVLLRHLPPDSALGRELYGEEVTWSRTDHLLATLIDSVQTLTVLVHNVWTNGARMPQPKPIPRPGLPESDQDDGKIRYGRPLPLDEVKAILAASRPGAGQEVTGGD